MEQKYIWQAVYKSGDTFAEYETHDGVHVANNFNDIDKKDLARYELVSAYETFGFDASTGIFNINGRELAFSYWCESSGVAKFDSFTDIIQYKDAESLFNPATGESRTGIVQYNIGYKAKSICGNYSLRCILKLPVYGKPYINIRMTSRCTVDGKLRIKLTENEAYFDAPLAANVASEINWLIPKE